jgi:hypothetical protein
MWLIVVGFEVREPEFLLSATFPRHSGLLTGTHRHDRMPALEISAGNAVRGVMVSVMEISSATNQQGVHETHHPDLVLQR